MPFPTLPFAIGRRPARRVAAGVAVLAVAGGAVTVSGRESSATAGYRTAAATTQAVDRVLDRVATVEPVTQASVAFPTGGTVAAVDVAVGDRVTVGQELARLDVDSLQAARTEAQAALDEAELTLEQALAGEDVSGGPQVPGSTGGTTTASPAAEVGAAGDAVVTTALTSGDQRAEAVQATAVATTVDDSELAAAQQAVLDAQRQVDTDLALAQQALDDATAACATVGQATAPASSAPAGTDGTDGTENAVAACRDAIDAVLAAQQTVAADQDALAAASDALDALLDERAAEAPAGTPGTTTTTPPSSRPSAGRSTADGPEAEATAPSGGATTGEPSAGPSGQGSANDITTTSSPTAAELVAYQKDVDAAEDRLAVADQAVAQATIVSPIAGTVRAVGLAAGDEVTAGSATATVTVVGEGGYEVTTTVTVDDLPDLALGQPATVTPDGGDDLAGEVVRIGVAGTTTDTSTTYPVTIALADTTDETAPGNGATVSVGIVTASAEDALAVPTSAVTVDGDTATVTVIEAGESTTRRVELGVVGATWTEITDGLGDGDEIVLADLDAPLPSTATDGSSGGTSGTGLRGPGAGGGFSGPPPGG